MQRAERAGPGEERMVRPTNQKRGGHSKLPATNSSSCLLGNQYTPEIPSRLLNPRGCFEKPHWAPARERHSAVTTRLHAGPHCFQGSPTRPTFIFRVDPYKCVLGEKERAGGFPGDA